MLLLQTIKVLKETSKTDEKGKGLANAKFNVYREGEEKTSKRKS